MMGMMGGMGGGGQAGEGMPGGMGNMMGMMGGGGQAGAGMPGGMGGMMGGMGGMGGMMGGMGGMGGMMQQSGGMHGGGGAIGGMMQQFGGQQQPDPTPEMPGKVSQFVPKERAPPPDCKAPVARWEKAILTIKGIAQQVYKADDDGVEVIVAGDEMKTFSGINNVQGIMQICEYVQPGGCLNLGPALVQAVDSAVERLYGEDCEPRGQAILVVIAKKPDDADELIEKVKEAAKKVTSEEDLTITFVHVGGDAETEEFLSYIDDNLKVTTEETEEELDLVDALKDEDMKKAFAESQDPGFMAKGGTGALMGAFAGAAAGAGGYYMYQKHCINKRSKGFNGSWHVIGHDGQKTPVHLKVKDDMEGNLVIKGYPDEEPEDFGSEEEEDDDWDDEQDCPCCKGRGFFDTWSRPCEESSMHKDMDCPVCEGEGFVTSCLKRCKKCKGLGAFDCWGKPCMKNAMHYEHDCRRCKGKCYREAKKARRRDESSDSDSGSEKEERDPNSLPLWGRSTAKAKYRDETLWRHTIDGEEVIPGSLEDEHTVVWEDGTRWEEKREKVSYGKMALAGLGGAVLGGAAGYVIQKKFFSKASKKTPGDYVIILDSSAAMLEFDQTE